MTALARAPTDRHTGNRRDPAFSSQPLEALFDQVIELAVAYPYLTVATVFILCGVGLPMPEEIMLIFAGYATYKSDGEVSLPVMMVVCLAAILAGDVIPFFLGRTFGTRLLRLRLLRYWATKDRLVVFDRWFSKHGDYVIVIARFVAGFRVIAFFTAGTMKMSWRRFLILDGSGIAIIVPPVTWLSYRFGEKIDWIIAKAKEVEQGILYGALVAVAVAAAVIWFRRRQKRNRQVGEPVSVEVAPTHPRRRDAEGTRSFRMEILPGGGGGEPQAEGSGEDAIRSSEAPQNPSGGPYEDGHSEDPEPADDRDEPGPTQPAPPSEGEAMEAGAEGSDPDSSGKPQAADTSRRASGRAHPDS